MACYHLIDAWRPDSGGPLFFSEKKNSRYLQIACGQCVGCRLERSRQWAVRCVHENQMHKWSSFVTLTYSDEFLPADGSLRYRDFQLFMKRLRKHFECRRQRIRFYMCGEYGERLGRPHFHACLFGADFTDRVFWRNSNSGFPLYTSKILSELWPFGHSEIGDVSFESAAYVARYVMKKVTGDKADEHYKSVTPDGEVIWRVPEFTRMSLKPGIGATWFAKYHREVYPRDYVIVRGKKMKPPRTYDELLKRDDPVAHDFLKLEREAAGLRVAADNTPDRLAVKEIVTKARLTFKTRSIK